MLQCRLPIALATILLLSLSPYIHSRENSAKIVYVDVNGSDQSGDGTISKPWRSLTYAFGQIQPDSLNPVTMQVSTGVFGTVTTGEQFPIPLKSWTSVVGLGSNASIVDGAASKRLFLGEGVRQVRLANLSLKHGRARKATDGYAGLGGALYLSNCDNFTLLNCALSGNRADSSGGALFVTGSGTLLIRDCVLDSNFAFDGGACYFASESGIELRGTKIQHNTAQNIGGGIYVDGYLDDTTSLLSNCWVRWNRALQSTDKGAGGIAFRRSRALIGGDFSNANDIHENLGGENGAEVYAFDSETFVDARFNFWGALPTSALLAPVKRFDLKNPRNLSFTIPLGTIQFFVAASGSDENNGTQQAPWRSIHYALSQMFTTELDTFRIFVGEGIYSASAGGESFPIHVEDRINIIGAGTDRTVIDGEGAAQPLIGAHRVEDIRLSRLTLRNASSGAIVARNCNRLLLDSLLFEENTAVRGSGILLASCSNTIVKSNIFRRNSSTLMGGAVALIDDDSEVIGNLFERNLASRGGGVLCDSSSKSLLEANHFRLNTAGFGGAIYCSLSRPKVIGNFVLDNIAEVGGGAIAMDGASEPLLGANKNSSNDIYDNVCYSVRGSQLYRTESGLTVDARYNYWGTIPDSVMIYPYGQFSVSNYRNLSIRLPAGATELFVSPSGSDKATGTSPASAFRTITQTFKLLFGEPQAPVRVTLLPGRYSQESTGEIFPIQLKSHVKLAGSGVGATIVDANATNRIFEGRSLTGCDLAGMTLTGGNTSLRGGALFLESVGNARVDSCEFLHNSALEGGAIFAVRSPGVEVANSFFTNNEAMRRGGAIAVDGDSLSVTRSTFLQNRAELSGGAVKVGESAFMAFWLNRVIANSAPRGGGLSLEGGSIRLFNNTIINNEAFEQDGGGGIYTAATAFAIIGGSLGKGNDLYDNRALQSGAALAGESRSAPLNARFNYFGKDPDGSVAGNAGAYDTTDFLTASMTIPVGSRTAEVAPHGNDEILSVTAASPLRTIRQTLRLFYRHHFVINLHQGVYGSSTNGEQFPLQLPSNVMIAGVHADSTLLEAPPDSRVFEIENRSQVTLQNMTLHGGQSSQREYLSTVGDGGGILVSRSRELLIQSVVFRDLLSSDRGGGLAGFESEALAIKRCTFERNSGIGGSVFLKDCSGEIANSMFFENRSPVPGSAMRLENSEVHVAGCRVSRNHVDQNELGGAIHCVGPALPRIGGGAGMGNDIFLNTGGSKGMQLSRQELIPVIDGQYNYFATLPPTEEQVFPLNGFNLEFTRELPLGENNPPLILSVSPPSEQTIIITRGDTVRFRLLVVDADDDPLSYLWTLDGFQNSFAPQFDLITHHLRPGEHDVEVKISDGLHAESIRWKVSIFLTAVEDRETAPTRYSLLPAYPNPLRNNDAMLTVSFGIPSQEQVKIVIHDLLGRTVRILTDEPWKSGNHELRWDGKDSNNQRVISGLYFLKMTASDKNLYQRVLILK